jgi:hypothetical protein
LERGERNAPLSLQSKVPFANGGHNMEVERNEKRSGRERERKIEELKGS